MAKIVTFGEIMLRLKTEDFLRFRQALPGRLEATFAGAEANVAASLALFGAEAVFVTALPDNPLAEACLGTLRNLGVDVSRVVRTERGRLGIYFVEAGANQRPSNVLYDRDGSSVSLADPAGYDWDAVFRGASWFHWTGITPSLSRTAADAVRDAVRRAKDLGLPVSCDLNFRKKLWNWEPGTPPRALASRVMRELLPFVDVLAANEEDARDVLGIDVGALDSNTGSLDPSRYPEVARRITELFPNIRKIAVTLRESVSATHNEWGGMLYDAASGTASFAPMADGVYRPYPIRAIVDRIGGGDSFSAALILAFLDEDIKNSDADAVAFAAAASCLCHSIHGDFNYSSREEVLALMGGKTSGRINR
ncbi:MAG TPA: sugar kinase [Magnetospirillaceae bacterium]|nr:sugar kinase [Magnetospirillaceae bacterium]